jgi:23S rRNA (uracil1939-C5)-methyltransferase
MITPSTLRIAPICEHFGVCGGCKWQCLPYGEQLKYKQQQVEDNLRRIGKIELPEITPILGSKEEFGYRNKLEFSFSNKRWLTKEQVKSGEVFTNMNAVGFHIPGAFDKILDINKCHLMDDICNRLRNSIRDYAINNNISFYDIKKGEGVLRNMMIRLGMHTSELMLLLQFRFENQQDEVDALGLMGHLRDNFPEITSLLYVNNTKCNDTIHDLDVHTFHGTDFIYETMEDLKFKIGPKSFFQTNSRQAYRLYSVVREMAGLKPDDVLYDLYTGTGTIAQFLARSVKKVVGIEYVPEAIEDAKINAELNDIKNAIFFAGDMKDVLNADFISEHGTPDVIVTDPPRVGMHKDVVDVIMAASPKRIVYVSCNPATQARDIALMDSKYKVVAVQPVDMFPHTHHVEVVTMLELKES